MKFVPLSVAVTVVPATAVAGLTPVSVGGGVTVGVEEDGVDGVFPVQAAASVDRSTMAWSVGNRGPDMRRHDTDSCCRR
jgi:hypothetical protein